MNTKDKKTLHQLALENLDVKVGDKVKVLFKVPSKTGGWNNSWASPMNKSIGETLSVKYIDSNSIELSDGYVYPAFALEPVVTVALSENSLNATVYNDHISIWGNRINKVEFMNLLNATTETGFVDRADLEGLIEDMGS